MLEEIPVDTDIMLSSSIPNVLLDDMDKSILEVGVEVSPSFRLSYELFITEPTQHLPRQLSTEVIIRNMRTPAVEIIYGESLIAHVPPDEFARYTNSVRIRGGTSHVRDGPD